MRNRTQAWRFAPTMGGTEQGTNPGQQHFAPDPLRAMVRETIQNSLDHHQEGLPPVEVIYELNELDSGDIAAHELAKHAGYCLKEVQDNPEARGQYEGMLRLLRQPRITCLAIIDRNTTGLQDENWENLILREGVATEGGKVARGGSFGFGKNAPFNLAGASAVIYSTRYLDVRKKRGKVTRMMGRSQLRTHTGPTGPTGPKGPKGPTVERLQSVGFLGAHETEWNQPLEGPEIPRSLLLKESGTGVYIIGFEENLHPDWQQEIAEAATTQFFAAIRWKNLVVRVGNRTIDHRTLDEEMQTTPEETPARHYHLALEREPRNTRPSGRLVDSMGSIAAWIMPGENAPRRLAHINRRGMLITESQELGDNPLCPQRTGKWGAWCAVSMAADEKTDGMLRRMEPPAHDAIRPGQLRDNQQQQNARRELEEWRKQIREFLREELEEDNRRNSTNVEELAKLFPVTGRTKGRDLEYKPQKLQPNSEQDIEIEEPGDEPGDGPADGPAGQERGTGGQPGSEGRTGGNMGTGSQKAAAKLRNTRIVRNGPRTLIMAFTMPQDSGRVRYGLRAAGEQYQRNEKPIGIQDVLETRDITASAHLEDGEIVVESPPNTRVNLMITLEEDQDYLSYRLAIPRDET